MMMAENTPASLRNLVIYETYIRNHTREGTFRAFEADLPRIKQLGVDVVWLMPIHPIGSLHKKGTLGCPYSIADYRKVNPEYGTLDDFKHLVAAIHNLGMRVMIDVVYNHTAHDSVLVKQHPGFFHQDEDGHPITTVPEWSDVIDLKHPNPELSEYLIESLCYWSRRGVDGFRCDVASLVPLDFWRQARARVAELNPQTIWLAESVHAAFLEYRHKYGLSGYSDSEMYQAFDLTYDYDVWALFQAIVGGIEPPRRLLEMYRFQEAIYPANYIKLHFAENHDQRRMMSLAPTPDQALAWTAFQGFNRGAFMIYGGQETAAQHTPTLFDRDPVDWTEIPLQDFLSRLCRIKKHPAVKEGIFTFEKYEPLLQVVYAAPNVSLLGLFNVRGVDGPMDISLPDGVYHDLLNDQQVTVKDQQLTAPSAAAILEAPYHLAGRSFFSRLLDTDIKPI